MFIEHNSRSIGREHVQENRLHFLSFCGHQVPEKRIQQQRSDTVPPIFLADTQGQNIPDVGYLGEALRQDVHIFGVQGLERLDLGHNQPYNISVVDCCQRIKPT